MLFQSYVALCVSKARHRLGRESVSWCLETSLLKIFFPGWDSLPGTELPPHFLVVDAGLCDASPLPGAELAPRRGYRWARNLWVLIIYLFLLPVMFPSVVPKLTTDTAVRVFPGVWKPLFFKTPFLGWISVPTSFVSLFIFFIFSYLLSNTMGCFSGCLMSSAGIQKLFCGIHSAFKCSFEEFVREKVVFPSYSSAIFT